MKKSEREALKKFLYSTRGECGNLATFTKRCIADDKFKAIRPELRKLRDEIAEAFTSRDMFHRFDGLVSTTTMNMSCGLVELYGLRDVGPRLQAIILFNSFFIAADEDYTYADEAEEDYADEWNIEDDRYFSFTKEALGTQVLFSDSLCGDAWPEAKKLAYKGPITINPNSDNKIRVYIFTADLLPKLWKA